jgi:hypothetical protein
MSIADARVIRERLDWRPRFADLDTIVGHALEWERRYWIDGGRRAVLDGPAAGRIKIRRDTSAAR